MTDNELIAEFMGAKDYKHESGVPHYYFSVRPHSRTNTIRRKSSLEYDSSWDWLMPVVEKIAKDHDFTIQFFAGDCIAYANKQNLEHTEITSYGNFEPYIANVYKTVVAFIKWCNKNKTS